MVRKKHTNNADDGGDDDDDLLLSTSPNRDSAVPRPSIPRGVLYSPPRRKSTLAQRMLSAVELEDLFSNCIKLSAENKVNVKNAWQLNLIDHMETILNEKDNFQIASCTLDAGVKIYSYRVDSIHTETFKVLSGLSRTQKDAHEHEAESGDPTGAEEGGAKEHSKKHVMIGVNTLENNLEHLNLKKLEVEFVGNSLLRNSTLFDQGSAQGLLLNNLTVANQCEIVIDTMEEFETMVVPPTPPHVPPPGSEQSSSTDVIASIPASFLLPSPLPPTDPPLETTTIPLNAPEDILPNPNEAPVDVILPPDFKQEMDQVANFLQLEGTEMPLPASEFDDGHDLDVDDDDDDDAEAAIVFAALQEGTDTTGAPATEGVDIEDEIDALLNSTGVEESTVDTTNMRTKTTKPRRQRVQFFIDFLEEIDKDFTSAFAVASSSRANQLASTTRASKAAMNFLLPEEGGYPVDQFFTPFHLKNHRFRNGNLERVRIGPLTENESHTNKGPVPESPNQNAVPFGDHGHDDDGQFPEDDDNNDDIVDAESGYFGGDIAQPAMIPPSEIAPSTGDLISVLPAEFGGRKEDDNNTAQQPVQLVAAPRMVEKIDINYATKVKKVDVRALKTTLWSQLSPSDHAKTDEKFSTLVSTLPQHAPPNCNLGEISVPFCFICLLHLANEKGLVITGQSDLQDLRITSSLHQSS